MKMERIIGSLFDYPKYFNKSSKDKMYLVQCISADCAMGAGIAVQFNNKYNMKNKILNRYPDTLTNIWDRRRDGFVILEDNVFNLVTKRNYWEKPSYRTMRSALENMKEIIEENNIRYLSMPCIGCGLDELNWDKVENMIKEIFLGIDLNIKVFINWG